MVEGKLNRDGNRPLRIGLAGLGAVGIPVAEHLDRGIDGLVLSAVAVRDREKARRHVEGFATVPEIVDIDALAEHADVVVEGLPASLFRSVAEPILKKGGIFVPASVGALLTNFDLVDLARAHGGRIIVPTGALLGLDAVRAAAQGTINSITMTTRKPPGGLAGAPYLLEHGPSMDSITEPTMVFEGTAREAAAGFPANLNVAVALSLAGIGPDKTRLQIWADPTVTRNTHIIDVDSDSARFHLKIENIPSDINPRTGRITGLSVVAALRSLVDPLRVGT
ncbi:aspartate dehydrogenase [Fodinicurvata sp. EGI_FJ10296]|uniref:aspartate dehydrogenase n=1 Tax=Fodinicurvata sp. EGI_FJ10296 TaxID=3231908 RepID=UPI0034565680